MRYIYAIPLVGLILVIYNLITGAELLQALMMDSESLIIDGVLPSGAEFYLKIGALLAAAAIALLPVAAYRVLKCSSILGLANGAGLAVAVIAIGEFLFLPYCGTDSFFLIMIAAIAEAAINQVGYSLRRRED